MTDKVLNWALLGVVVVAEVSIVLVYQQYCKKVLKNHKIEG